MAYPIITLIGTIIVASATMVTAGGDNAASMMVAWISGGKNGIVTQKQPV